MTELFHYPLGVFAEFGSLKRVCEGIATSIQSYHTGFCLSVVFVFASYLFDINDTAMLQLIVLAATAALASCSQISLPPHNYASSHQAANDPPSVTVKNGTLQGRYSKEYNQDFFLGVPFAQPPVGDLRFRAARSINTTWTGVKNATTYSPECVGYGGDDWPYPLSEDCLYLNVIRPAGLPSNASLPIALWYV